MVGGCQQCASQGAQENTGIVIAQCGEDRYHKGGEDQDTGKNRDGLGKHIFTGLHGNLRITDDR